MVDNRLRKVFNVIYLKTISKLTTRRMRDCSFKNIVRKVHLILGLAIGLLFFVIALSGAIYTWEPEFSTLLYKQRVPAQDISFVTVSALKAKMAEEFPEGDFRGVLFQGKERTANVLLYVPGSYYYAFMDPYSGELVHLQDMKMGWLNTLKLLHRNLLLGDVGKKIVHWVTLLSLFMVISGLLLWWPHRKSRRTYHFTIRWKARRVQLNYDLHNVLGFYASWVAVFSILTGIFWGFAPFQNVLKMAAGEDEISYEVPISDVSKRTENHDLTIKVDSLAYAFQQIHTDRPLRVNFPHNATEAIRIAVVDPGHRVVQTDLYHFDQYTGQQLHGNFEGGLHNNASAFKTLNNLVYDIHLGSIGGFLGRLLVCITSLILASLPITGFIIWLSKRKTVSK